MRVGQNAVRRILAGLGLVLTMTIAASATADVKIQQDAKMPELWTMSNGRVQVQVNAKLGRIMHYGFIGGRNLFWVNNDPTNPKYDLGGFTNYGGDKIWPWPQDLFGWPPPEPKEGYSVSAGKDGKTLVMTAEMPKFGVKVTRVIDLADDSSTMSVSSTFEPTSTSFGKPLGVWSITQVPTPPMLFVRIPLLADRQRYLENLNREKYQASATGNVVQLIANNSKDGVKTFMDADVIAAAYEDVVLLQRQLPVQKEGIWNADERAQIYTHLRNASNIPAGPGYTELEWTAPVLPPTRVAQSPLKVIYKAVKLSAKTTPADIMQMIEKLP